MQIRKIPFRSVFVSALIMGHVVVNAAAIAQQEGRTFWGGAHEPSRPPTQDVRERLREHEKKSRENRNSRIERTLASIISSYQDEQPASNQDVTAFAHAVLLEFLADKDAEEGAVEARDEVLSLLEDQKNATRVRANVHRWLEADATLKRVFASRQEVQIHRVAYEAGIVQLDSVIDAQSRLSGVELAFLETAFDLFPLNRDERTARAIDKALTYGRVKRLRRDWQGALRMWAQIYSRYAGGRTGGVSANEAQARLSLYSYEARLHAAEADLFSREPSRPPTGDVREGLREHEKKIQENRNSQIERTLVNIISSYEDEQPPSNQDVTAFAHAVLLEFLPDKDADKGAVEARDEVLSLLEDQKNATMVRPNVHRWLEAAATLKGVFASRQVAEALRLQNEVGMVRLDYVIDAQRHLSYVELAFFETAFDLFPLNRDERTARAIDKALTYGRVKPLRRAWQGALRMWAQVDARRRGGVEGGEATTEAQARERLYFHEARLHAAEADLYSREPSRQPTRDIRERLREHEKKIQENRNSRIERTLASILSSYQDKQPPSNQDVTAFARAVLLECLPDKDAEEGAVEARDEVLSLLEDQKNATRVRANVHRWLETDATLKRVFASRQEVRALRVAYQAGMLRLDLFLDAQRRLSEVELAFLETAFDLFPLNRNERTARAIDRALTYGRVRQLRWARQAALRTWVRISSLRIGGLEGGEAANQAQAHERLYFHEARLHAAEADLAKYSYPGQDNTKDVRTR